MGRIQIGARTYTDQDLREGRHHDDPNIDPAESTEGVTNIASGGVTGIQAGTVRGGITID